MTDYTKLIERANKATEWAGTVAADILKESVFAIEALQGEVERLNRESQNLSNQLGDCDRARLAMKAERDALQAKLDATHAVLDSDDSKIVRNAADGYPEGREPRELTLSERVEALCTYATDWKRWCEEVQAKLDELQRQAPVASIYISAMGREFDDWKCELPLGRNELYAAPKALKPDERKLVRNAALEEAAQKCNGRLGGALQSADWWSGFKTARNQCIAAIESLKEPTP